MWFFNRKKKLEAKKQEVKNLSGGLPHPGCCGGSCHSESVSDPLNIASPLNPLWNSAVNNSSSSITDIPPVENSSYHGYGSHNNDTGAGDFSGGGSCDSGSGSFD